ncbi:hypothetical protein MNBD_PLANCTO02-3316 [hydrothermal vent metagenome]|uniref:Uncharacterized protein n=1 Tax=hydrothermal vent metagenome TaxID=652676 RepID=A0A3B1DJZ0_9ZZZZ
MSNVVLEKRKLHEEAHQEAERHKWIESQKCGHDRGNDAIQEWYRLHWPHYCRCKRLEHLRGLRRWDKFDDDRFGSLVELIREGDLLLDMILDRISNGAENLTLINWAYDWGLCVKKVREILVIINVNCTRLDPENK